MNCPENSEAPVNGISGGSERPQPSTPFFEDGQRRRSPPDRLSARTPRIGTHLGLSHPLPPNMEYFAGLDVSMEETHVCVVTQNGAVMHEVKAPSTPAGIAAALARVPACRWGPVRDRPDGADALPRLEPAWITRRLRREPAGLSRAEVISDAQDRPQRCTQPGASRPHRLLQARSCEVPAGTRCPVADHRSQEAGRPAGHSGESDPRPCRGIRRPTATCAQPRLHQAGAPGERGNRRPVRRHAGSGCGACRRARRRRDDRRGHKTDGQGIRRLPPADEHSRCRPTYRACLHSCS